MTLVIFAFLIAPPQTPKLTVRRSSPRLGGRRAYLLLCRVGDFGLRSTAHVTGLGFLVMGLFGAHHFGRFHGGNFPADSGAR